MTASVEENPGEAQARRLERMNEQLAALMRQPDVARRLRTAPGENEWSAMQTVGHVAEMIPYWLSHCRARRFEARDSHASWMISCSSSFASSTPATSLKVTFF